MTLCSDVNVDDDWIVRRYNSYASYDDSYHLLNGDIISLFHVSTDKPALYSHPILLDDGSQEVSCFGNGNEENHKVYPILKANYVLYYYFHLLILYEL